MRILVTGGTGYIGTHCCIALIKEGIKPVIIDNLSNSHPVVLERIKCITGFKPDFIHGDLRDKNVLSHIFVQYDITAVIHLAGLKAVSESVSKPFEYFDNNICGSLSLIASMREARVKTLIFSSSATVYGMSDQQPVSENFARSAVNPYGHSKLMVENILENLAIGEPDWRIIVFRYFNPAGAHESGLVGEDPIGVPNNLAAYICQVAIGRRKYLSVFGADYNTRDGTGLRDYIHVMDLAEGHLSALDYLCKRPGYWAVNLGTGQNVSVFEMLKAFRHASRRDIPFRIVQRRPGDVAECWADPSLAYRLLGWKAHRTLNEICIDAWHWQKLNSFGYLDKNANNHAKAD
uniref:UDP-glucose 4-epimerase n=1 Tax=Candidatus Kentrum sp. LPFa TaxID=2126335 RepID=A0A450W3X2_9GAMM|nr:MAG: UDP-glucose 4-epimerase [Candidatus Kentron sp. LPFa]